MPLFRLSKSKIISGLQCPKRLYLEVHRPDLIEHSTSTERSFAIGNRVGEIARRDYPGGKLIEHTHDIKSALGETESALNKRAGTTIFEAAFQYGGGLVRSDIFTRAHCKHHVVEVKSSASVKEYHLSDAAIQRWVIGGAGYPLDSISIAHINSSFVYKGNGNYNGLFKHVDVTEETEGLTGQVPTWIQQFRKMLAGKLPRIDIGPQCSKPFDCPFIKHCSKGEPEFPVEILPRGAKVAASLRAAGYSDLRKVPASLIETSKHKLIWRVTKSGKAEVDPRARKMIRELPYPRFYLDFETIAFPVPIWKDTRPFQALPFQWSCHIEREGGELTHKEFLDVSGDAPMRAFAESLIKNMGSRGPIIVYTLYERTIIKSLIERFPDLELPLNKIIGRLRDLCAITENSYYHRDMKGSWSLKAVLPTIASDLDYAKVGEVQDGGMAQDAYQELINSASSSTRKQKLKNDLREYCKLDTMATVRLARFLGKV